MRSITFVANTAQFAAPVQRSAGEVRALSAALKDAQKVSRESFREMELQAKAAGAGDAELRKIQQQRFREELAFSQAKKQLDAENVAGSKQTVSAEQAKKLAVEATTRALELQRAEVARQLPLEEGGGHYSPTRVQRNGALIRGGGVRAAELSASFLPGFDKIASFAFPILGLGTLAMEIGRGIGDLQDKLKEARETAMRLRDGFQEINQPIRTSTDELLKQNAQLDIAIAKIQHKPTNGLALALAEARLEADRLAESASKGFDEIQKLLKANQNGLFSQVFLGKGDTSMVTRDITDKARKLRDYSSEYNDAVHRGASPAELAKIKGNIDSTESELLKYTNAELAKRRGTVEQVWQNSRTGAMSRRVVPFAEVNGSQDENINALEGIRDYVYGQRDYRSAAGDNQQKTNTLKTLESRKELSAAGLAAQKKAEEEQRKQWDLELADLESAGDATAEKTELFWVNKENATKRGSENYLYADRKALEAQKKANEEKRKLDDERLKWQMELDKQQRQSIAGGAIWSTSNAYAKGIGEASRTSVALRQQQDDAARSIAEQSIQWQEQFGHISRADAALQMQKLHTEQYVVSLQRLREAFDAVSAGPDADAERNQISSQIVDLQTRRAMQQMQDQASIMQSTMMYSMQQQGKGLLDGLNSDLATASTEWGRRGQYNVGRRLLNSMGGTLRSAGGSLTKMGLEKVESIFGVGKPDGSRGNPLNVRVVNGFGGAFGGLALPSLPSADAIKALGGDGGSVSDFAKGLFGSILGGSRAGGGPTRAGRSYLFGENGPELFTPESNGYVSTAERTSQLMGGGGRGDTYVDARGSSDPAQVRWQARRGSVEGYAAAQRSHGDALREDRRRRPLSAR